MNATHCPARLTRDIQAPALRQERRLAVHSLLPVTLIFCGMNRDLVRTLHRNISSLIEVFASLTVNRPMAGILKRSLLPSSAHVPIFLRHQLAPRRKYTLHTLSGKRVIESDSI
jgi:hypothetical protein